MTGVYGPVRWGLAAGPGIGRAACAVVIASTPASGARSLAAGTAGASSGAAADLLRVPGGGPHEQPGIIQLNSRSTGRCNSRTPGSGTSKVPATAWLTAITATTPPQAALIRRLIDRNSGVCQYSRGTVTRAYCSVNGMTGSVTRITAARIAAALARP